MKEYQLTLNNHSYQVSVEDLDNQSARVCVNGEEYLVSYPPQTAPAPAEAQTAGVQAISDKAAAANPARQMSAPIEKAPAGAKAAASYEVTSPLPGIILQVLVQVGGTVRAGDPLLVLEAMKMENVIEAEKDGKILEIKVNQGDSVLEGAPLLVIG